MEYEFLCKTFRCCIDEDCDSCPLYDFEIEHCEKQIKLQALSFIIRQQAEIEKLKKVGNKIDSAGVVATLIDTKERFVRIKNKWEREVRAEAIKEFAERLKEAFPQTDRNNICPALYYDDYCYIIDELAEEMTEKEGGNNGTEDKH